jgi:hypothetical protein
METVFNNMSEFLGSNWELVAKQDPLDTNEGEEFCWYKWKLPGVAAPYVKRQFEESFPDYEYHLYYIGGQGTFTTVSKPKPNSNSNSNSNSRQR